MVLTFLQYTEFIIITLHHWSRFVGSFGISGYP